MNMGKEASLKHFKPVWRVLEDQSHHRINLGGHKPYLAYHIAGMGLKTKWVIFT